MLRLAHPALSHEEVFLERYERLLAAAASLTAGDREVARELVHEAYLHFVLARPPLHPLDRIEGYLFVTIRNLHISQVRRRARRRQEPLTLVDFDSAALGWRTLSVAHRVEAVDELCWICEYALQRRVQIRAASAFLLHYFLRYRPSEIAAVLQSPLANIHKLLHVARADVRRALETRVVAAPRFAGAAGQSTGLAGLRLRILQSSAGACLSQSRLTSLYDATTPIDAQTAANIVGCLACLDRVNGVLGLPRLADRDRDGDDGPPGRSGGDAGREAPRRASTPAVSRGEATAAREHRPKELRIVVNGLPVGMQRVAGTQNEQVIRLSVHEPVTFIEVFSEQDVRLLLLNAEPLATGAAHQATTVQLSDDRQLEAALDLSDLCPTVRVSYRDPLFTAIDRSDEAALDTERTATRISARSVSNTEDEAEDEAQRGVSWTAHLLDAWRKLVRLLSGHPRQRRALQVAAVIVLAWLLFLTPGASVSAAELAYRAVVHFVTDTWRSLTPSAALPAVKLPPGLEARPAAPLSLPVVPAPPVPQVSRGGLLERSRAELLALAQLQRVGSYLGQEVRFAVGREGRARVEAIVSDAHRQTEIRNVLRPLSATQPIEVQILTVQELADRERDLGAAVARRGHVEGRASARPAVRAFEFDRDRIGATDTLLGHFGSQQAVRSFANEMLNRSLRASRHVWALQHLSERFAPDLVQRLAAPERDVLADLVEHHAREIGHEINAIANALRPVFAPHARPNAARSSPLDATNVWDVTRQLLDLNRTRDEAMRTAFVVSSVGGQGLDLTSVSFWHVLETSHLLAQQLQRDSTLLDAGRAR